MFHLQWIGHYPKYQNLYRICILFNNNPNGQLVCLPHLETNSCQLATQNKSNKAGIIGFFNLLDTTPTTAKVCVLQFGHLIYSSYHLLLLLAHYILLLFIWCHLVQMLVCVCAQLQLCNSQAWCNVFVLISVCVWLSLRGQIITGIESSWLHKLSPSTRLLF